MAERLENYEFNAMGGPSPKYPWDEWLDGSTWCITRGADFDVKPFSMRSAVQGAGERRGLRIQTQIKGDSLVFRAIPKEGA
jgi:hypothetical protein